MTVAEDLLHAAPTWTPAPERGHPGEHPPTPRAFHRTFPEYAPTPLRDAPACAAALGIAAAHIKDETARLGLPAFKILGASWAVRRAVLAHAGRDAATAAPSLDELRAVSAELHGLRLCTATDGNHGRAVARMARLLGLGASVYMPAGSAQARVEAIASEGADVTVVPGGYDDAVQRAAADAGDDVLVISDTSWPGYADVPRWVIEGYATIFEEIDEATAVPATLVPLPVGVGALAAAAVRHHRRSGAAARLVSVEPTRAACVLASVRAGELRTVDAPVPSVMAGLQCETPSLVAWPELHHGLDAYVAIDDDRVPRALRLLEQDGVVAGETGAATLAGLLLLAERGELRPDDRALILVTEGATDPAGRARLLASA